MTATPPNTSSVWFPAVASRATLAATVAAVAPPGWDEKAIPAPAVRYTPVLT